MDQISNPMRKAASLLEAGNTEAARATLAKILRANPHHAQAWYLLSFALQTPDRQIYALRRTLRIDPDHVKAKDRLAELTGQSSAQAPAPAWGEKRAVDSLQEATSLLKVGYAEAARSILKGTLRANPHQEQAWYLMSFADPTQRGQISALKQTLRLNPDHEQAKARLVELTGQPVKQEPTPAWEEEKTVDPLHEADSLLKVGDTEAAYTILRGSLRVNPDHVRAWYLMSFADQTQRGQINALKQTLRINPGHEQAKARLAKVTGLPIRLEPAPVRGIVKKQFFTPEPTPARKKWITPSSTQSRVAKYTLVRAIVLFLTVVVAVYLTIFVANLGGYVDEVVRNNIAWSIAGMRLGGWLNDVPVEERNEIIEQTMLEMEDAAGLNEPFVIRCFRWLGRGLTLNWGESRITSGSRSWSSRSRDIRLIILENLPRTLLIFGTANLFLFFTSVFLALPLTKRYGGWLDRLVITLSPISSAPSWVFGVVLNLIFIRVLGIMSTGGTFDAWPQEFTLAYLPIVLKQMLLPFLAIFLSGLFQGIYVWRTFFLIYSSEDHVEMAKAKGLPPRMLERKYILRPVLPNLITSFALLFIVLWQEVIALEYFFNVAGIGRLFVNALRAFDTPVIVGLVVTFAYLLAITIFFLDLIYALVDPRVRIGSESQTAGTASRRRKRGFRLRRSPKPLVTRKLAWNPHSDFTPSTSRRARITFSDPFKGLWKRVKNLKPTFRELARYPSAVVGLMIIVVLIGVSIYTVFAIPYDRAIELWRGGEDAWSRNPKAALPVWVNVFRKDELPVTIILDSRDEPTSKSAAVVSETMTEITISFPFDYPYGAFPQEVAVYIDAQYDEKLPQLSLIWLTPDGREIEVGTYSIHKSFSYFLSQDKRLQRKLDEQDPIQMLFANPTAETQLPLNGTYEMQIRVFVFEEDADVDAEFVLYGQVYGLAGTDSQRRDLMVALLWGLPVALSFGLLAAVGTSVSTMVIAAVGTWFGGWVDNLVQRITEVNMVLPFLPVSLMVYTLYSKSFWVILGVTVLLSIFGSAVKNYRAIFLQVKQEPYIEVARSYSASDLRIIFRYLIPRIIPVLIPQLVILVPSYVFLEATLAFLGVSDPVLPTWGKLLVDGLSHGTYSGDYHLVLEPLSLLMLIGLAFVLLGLALERIFQPRLREM